MAARVVYDGQVGGNEGTLFHGMSFWVASRVPMRDRVVQNIKNNGGIIEKMDKNAQFLIADHARKDAPAGSYSWKWIEDSVRAGDVQHAAAYSIGVPGPSNRPPGSVRQKGTRTPFTSEDDRLLIEYVTPLEAKGAATKGNAIYQDFERKHPHHTYQSWRDRWVSTLQYKPRPRIEDIPAQVLSQTPRSQIPPSQIPPSQIPPSTFTSSARTSRVRFTEEDDAILREHIRDEKTNLKGNVLYQDLAVKFPHHTAQSWRDRCVRYVLPKLQNGYEQEPEHSFSHNERPKWMVQDTRVSLGAVSSISNNPPAAQSSQAVQQSRAETYHTPQKPGKRNMLHAQDQHSRSNTLAAASPNPDEDDPTPDSNGVEHHELDDQETRPTPQTTKNTTAPQSTPTLQQSLPDEKEQFYQHLGDFMESIDRSMGEVNLWPTIRGKTFELWDLWQAVMSQKVEPAERDWDAVAADLGYNWVIYKETPGKVRDCYEKYLAEFEEAMVDFEVQSDEVVTPASVNVHDQQQSGSPDNLNSSPPPQPSLKRSFGSAVLSEDFGLVYTGPSQKRSKLSTTSEIPSTPDAENGTFHLREQTSAGVSPSDRRYSTLPRSSRTSSSHGLKGKHSVSDNRGAKVHLSDLSALQSSRKSATEPETQDFRYDPETQAFALVNEQFDDLQSSQNEVTPSQQLLTEMDEATMAARRSYNAQTTPTPNRTIKSPFLLDADDDRDQMTSPKARFGKGPNPLLSEPSVSILGRSPPRLSGSSEPKSSKQCRSMPGSWKPAVRSYSQDFGPSPSPPAKNSSQPARARFERKVEDQDDVVNFYVSLRYPEAIVRRSLDATTWHPSLAGIIMEKLSNGEPIPTNYEGVWSPRDDEHLRLIDSVEAPRDEKEARKRAKALAKLENKHGEERINLRRIWLASKAKP